MKKMTKNRHLGFSSNLRNDRPYAADYENRKKKARQVPEGDIYGVKVDELSTLEHFKFNETSQIYRF